RRFDVDAFEGSAALLEVRAARMLASVDALFLRPAQLLRHLVDREIERDELVAVRGLRANDRPLADGRELDRLIRHPAVPIRAMRDLHVQSLRLRGEGLN